MIMVNVRVWCQQPRLMIERDAWMKSVILRDDNHVHGQTMDDVSIITRCVNVCERMQWLHPISKLLEFWGKPVYYTWVLVRIPWHPMTKKPLALPSHYLGGWSWPNEHDKEIRRTCGYEQLNWSQQRCPSTIKLGWSLHRGGILCWSYIFYNPETLRVANYAYFLSILTNPDSRRWIAGEQCWESWCL